MKSLSDASFFFFKKKGPRMAKTRLDPAKLEIDMVEFDNL